LLFWLRKADTLRKAVGWNRATRVLQEGLRLDRCSGQGHAAHLVRHNRIK